MQKKKQISIIIFKRYSHQWPENIWHKMDLACYINHLHHQVDMKRLEVEIILDGELRVDNFIRYRLVALYVNVQNAQVIKHPNRGTCTNFSVWIDKIYSLNIRNKLF